jgi:muconate cycloisomerase
MKTVAIAANAMRSRIASFESFVVRYPVIADFKFLTSAEGRPPTRDTVVVKLTDHEGNVSWGQSVPSHTWSYETVETVSTTLERYLGPALIGMDAFETEEIWRVMNRTIAASFSTGQPICKAGIDLALFDLTGRILNQTARQRWGRTGNDAITLSWTIDPRTIEDVERSVAEARARGFRNFNVKVGSDAAFDVLVCCEIRRQAPDAFVWVDANGGYDLATALTVAPQFADAGIAAFEQPLPANRLSGYRQLRRQQALPILMDEGIVTLADLEEFHQLGLLDGVAMKVSRCGGLTESRSIIEAMQERGLLLFASGLTDPDLALAASVQLFSAYDLEYPAALNAPQYLRGTILLEPVRIEGDQAWLPSKAGLGVEVDVAALRQNDLVLHQGIDISQ